MSQDIDNPAQYKDTIGTTWKKAWRQMVSAATLRLVPKGAGFAVSIVDIPVVGALAGIEAILPSMPAYVPSLIWEMQAKTVATTKHEYLLRGHIRCRHCGRGYAGSITARTNNDGKRYVQRYYRCRGKLRMYSPLEHCDNKTWTAKKIEGLVWGELEHYLSNRDLIINELEKQRQGAGQESMYKAELERMERQLKALNREQHQLLQWALKDFPSDQVEAENRRLNKAKETLKSRQIELEALLKASQEAVINVPRMGGFIKEIQGRLPKLDFEGKRLALEMLGITVWLDGENIEVTGTIEPEKQVLRCSSDNRWSTSIYRASPARTISTEA
ncbi:recombinase zinc beta ribbon domain-containing protein [Chloroflexota bacterium]